MKSNPLVSNKRSRKRLQLVFPDDGLTQQNFQEETDINSIMAKFAKDGVVTHVNSIQGAYGDFSNVADYQLHLNQVMAAQDAFDQLPSAIRARFANDPAKLLAFVNDDRNYDEAVSLGLIPPKAPDDQVVPPPQPKGAKAPSGDAGGGDRSGAA